MASFWNVNVKVATYRLNEVISRLHGYDVKVTPEESGKVTILENNVATSEPIAAPKPAKPVVRWGKLKKAKKRAVPKTHRGLGWLIPKEQQLQEKARHIILSRGVQPFDLKGLIDDAMKLGGANTWHSYKAAVYRAIQRELHEGNLVRVSQGRYQRTGASFIETLGLSPDIATG